MENQEIQENSNVTEQPITESKKSQKVYETVFSYLQNNGSKTQKNIVDALTISSPSVNQALRKMINEGKVKREKLSAEGQTKKVYIYTLV